MVSKSTLKDNIRQHWKYAELAFKNEDFNSALTMYYKCMVACADLKIYREEGTVPSNHSKRFRVLERKFPGFYRPLDQNFSDYRDSYELRIKKETVRRMREDAEELTQRVGVQTEGD